MNAFETPPSAAADAPTVFPVATANAKVTITLERKGLPDATAQSQAGVTIVVGRAATSLPLSQIKTATPQAPASGGGVVTMQNAERGVLLHVGERFLLDLGDRGWKVRVADESILAPVNEPNAPPGSQGVFEALRVGQTKILATSEPPCLQAKPPCLMPTLFLEIPVTVLS